MFAWRDAEKHGDKLGLEEGEETVSFRNTLAHFPLSVDVADLVVSSRRNWSLDLQQGNE